MGKENPKIGDQAVDGSLFMGSDREGNQIYAQLPKGDRSEASSTKLDQVKQGLPEIDIGHWDGDRVSGHEADAIKRVFNLPAGTEPDPGRGHWDADHETFIIPVKVPKPGSPA